jgi:16S rRNA (cytosine967-C5)-methyltransferase
MKYFSHLNTAVQLLQQYDGSVPFGSFIKQHFSQHKKYGSKDRKNITQLCYAYFRLGKALPQLPTAHRVLTGLFLCAQQPGELLQHLQPEWNNAAHLTLANKIQLLTTAGITLGISDIFPWQQQLSTGIDYEQFCTSFLIQPHLFLRLRPGKAQMVKTKLQQAGISFKEVSHSCLALPNTTQADAVIETDKEAIVQDYSSQRIGWFMEQIRASNTVSKTPAVWDACAASGGKSILAFDTFKQMNLTVTDVRKSILVNLEKRFARAGISNYQAYTADLSSSTFNTPHPFDIIIADVPCSGSGTWSRTPEQLHFFDTARIEHYSALQQKIVHNLVPHVKKGGWLLYCTCSVFKQENEEMAALIQSKYNLQLHAMELLKGYDQQADTLFAALFTA